MTPTQRSLKLLREQGYHCEIVEKYNSFIRQRRDLWLFCDILCLKGKIILAVQTTSDNGGNMSAHIQKIKQSPCYEMVKDAGIKIAVHGWKKSGKRGKRKLWGCRIAEL